MAFDTTEEESIPQANRLSEEQALALLRDAPLPELMRRAD
jgi:hypothetical protein